MLDILHLQNQQDHVLHAHTYHRIDEPFSDLSHPEELIRMTAGRLSSFQLDDGTMHYLVSVFQFLQEKRNVRFKESGLNMCTPLT